MTGDPSHGGAIDVADAVVALRMAVRGEWLEAADIARDGSVISFDALTILQVAAGVN